MFQQGTVKPSWGSQFGLYRYRKPNFESYRENGSRIKGSLAIAGFVMVSVFIIVIWSFIFTTSDEVGILPVLVTELQTESVYQSDENSVIEPRMNYDQYYDVPDNTEEPVTTILQSPVVVESALELKDTPGVFSRPPVSMSRRHINLDDPKGFQYVWAGPRPSEFRKSKSKNVHENIQEIIGNLAEDTSNDTQAESSDAISKKAFKISGIYTIPKQRNNYDDQANAFYSGDQQRKYNGPFYAFRPASPLEVNLLSMNEPHSQQNPYAVNNNVLRTEYNDRTQGINYISGNSYQGNVNTGFAQTQQVQPKPSVAPMSLMLDIFPANGARTGRAYITKPQLKYSNQGAGINPYSSQSLYAPGVPARHNFHNINQRQLQQRHQNDFYNKYYRSRYFRNNEFANFGRPYYARKSGMEGMNRMVIHLNLFPEPKGIKTTPGLGAYARKADEDVQIRNGELEVRSEKLDQADVKQQEPDLTIKNYNNTAET